MVSNFKIQNMNLLTLQVSEIPMFKFIPRSRILPQFRVSLPITRRNCLSLSSSPSPLSDSENSPTQQHSFDVNYLINTFGWPPKLAISKAKYLKFKTPDKPDRVLAFFKEHGFNKTQISKIVKRHPSFLAYNPEKTLLPKIEFFSTLGLSRTEITDVITKEPNILRRGSKKVVVPAYNLLRSLVNSDNEAVEMVKQRPAFLTHSFEAENIQILLEAGVPGANIIVVMSSHHKWYFPPPDTFRRMVEEVKGMGFDPCTIKFLWALRMIRSLGKSKWDDKGQVFKKYGWSDRDILLAFEKDPQFIMRSKEKIERVLDFFVNKMGIEATDLTNWPVIFGMSLEKRIVPRCLVYRSMMEKGLCKRKVNIGTLCNLREGHFLSKIMKEAPELCDFYMEMLNSKK